jgi:hypothetical protein
MPKLSNGFLITQLEDITPSLVGKELKMNTGQIVGGIFAAITLALFVLNAKETTQIIGSLSASTNSFARTVIGKNAGN